MKIATHYQQKRTTWKPDSLALTLEGTYQALRKKKCLASERSSWWALLHPWTTKSQQILESLIDGTYHFEPTEHCVLDGEHMELWNFKDRIAIRALYEILKPTVKYVIPEGCVNLGGPNQVGKAIKKIIVAGCKIRFKYVIRMDIRSFYASIDRDILMQLIKENYDDPRIIKYLEAIVNHAEIDINGNYSLPKKGIPLRGSLSPFFGALYLSALDKLFEGRDDVFYIRYCDDVLIFFETRAQMNRGRKKIGKVLYQLKLKFSHHKTYMGPVSNGFHFLGAQFDVIEKPKDAIKAIQQTIEALDQSIQSYHQSAAAAKQAATSKEKTPVPIKTHQAAQAAEATPENQVQQQQGEVLEKTIQYLDATTGKSRNFPRGENHALAVTLHPRTCQRSLDKYVALQNFTVNPVILRAYLALWERWWQNATGLIVSGIQFCWMKHVNQSSGFVSTELMWTALSNLLPDARFALTQQIAADLR